MRISDWSSDVCSSDLDRPQAAGHARRGRQGRALLRQRPGQRGHRPDAERRLRRVPRMSPRVRQDVGSYEDIAAAAVRTTGLSDFGGRSEEHTSELQSLMRISYAVFCLKKKKKHTTT